MERYDKSTMPVNAEKYFMTHLEFELTTSATPPSTALSVTSTNCASNSADIGIPFANESLPDSENTSEIR